MKVKGRAVIAAADFISRRPCRASLLSFHFSSAPTNLLRGASSGPWNFRTRTIFSSRFLRVRVRHRPIVKPTTVTPYLQVRASSRMSGISEESTVSASSRVKFTEISSLSPEADHRLDVKCDGGWRILLKLPKQPTDDKSWHIGLFVGASASLLLQKFQRDTSHRLKITVTLKYLSGSVFKSRIASDIKWHPGKQDHGWSMFADWRKMWCNNPRMQESDGFLVLLQLDSLPGFESPSIDPPLLRTISNLCAGEDFADTKFWVFSRRQAAHGSIGAKDPKPIYANSQLLESQSEYFTTSKHSFICVYKSLLTM